MAARRAGASRRTGLSPSGDRWAGLGERSARRRGSENRGEGMGEGQARAGRRSGAGLAGAGSWTPLDWLAGLGAIEVPGAGEGAQRRSEMLRSRQFRL